MDERNTKNVEMEMNEEVMKTEPNEVKAENIKPSTIEEYNEILTVFYSNRTGVIKGLCQGKQDMSYFGVDAEDYALIWSFIYVPYNDFIFRNMEMYKVIDGKLTFKQDALPTF